MRGAGGRYLILHLSKQRKLAVFDCNEANIVKYLPVPADTIHFAAGLDKLFVGFPGIDVLQRWDLKSFTKEATAPSPVPISLRGLDVIARSRLGNQEDTSNALAMGSATHEPLIVQSGGDLLNLVFLDPVTFQKTGHRLARAFMNTALPQTYMATQLVVFDGLVLSKLFWWADYNLAKPLDSKTFQKKCYYVIEEDGGRGQQSTGLHVSANGQVISDGEVLVRVGKIYRPLLEGGSNLLPGPDGRVLYGNHQLYTSEGQPLGTKFGTAREMTWFVPALHGPYALSYNEKNEADARTVNLAVHLAGELQPLVTLPGIEGLSELVSDARGHPVIDGERGIPVHFDQHLFFAPDAKLLVFIPGDRDRLVLQRVDIEQMLDKAHVDYLYIVSSPPQEFKPGSDYTYRLEVRSRKGTVKYQLRSGPDGMMLSPEGVISWKVPADFAAKEVQVSIAVSDKSGKEIAQTFTAKAPEQLILGKAPEPIRVAVIPKRGPAPEVKQDPRDIAKGGHLVRAPAQVLPIKPAPIEKAKTTINLPASIRDLCVGGGGRFLILHLPQQRKFAVFDVNEAKIVKYLPVAEDKVLFAAGMDKLMVLLPDKKLVERWSLTTFEREAAAPLVIHEERPPNWRGRQGAEISSAVMGSASDGPLILGGPFLNGERGLPLRFLDIQTLKEAECTNPKGGNMVGHPDAPHMMRVSANGRTIGMWGSFSPSGFQSALLNGNSVRIHYEHTSVGRIIPGPDGETLYTGAGLYANDLTLVGQKPLAFADAIPSAHGHFYLSSTAVVMKSVPGNPFEKMPAITEPEYTIHLGRDTRPIAKLSDLEGGILEVEAEWERRLDRDILPADKRVQADSGREADRDYSPQRR